MTTVPTLDVVIVNWNTATQLAECLASFATAESGELVLSHIIVVDNASNDGSADCTPTTRSPVSIVRNQVNRGFAAACNQGAAGGVSKYVLFLNPDTRLFSNSLSEPLRFMERSDNADVAVVGIQLVQEDGRVARSCARAPSPGVFYRKLLGLDVIAPRLFRQLTLQEWDHSDSRDVDHVIGAFYLVRRSAWTTFGGFDERFFVYLEDLDFSSRVRAAGWRVHYLASAQAFHRGGGASSTDIAARLCFSLYSRIQYGSKHFGRWTSTALTLGVLLVEPIARILHAVGRRDSLQMRQTLQAYRRLCRLILSGSPPHESSSSSRTVHGGGA